jgi:hypothetical protein
MLTKVRIVVLAISTALAQCPVGATSQDGGLPEFVEIPWELLQSMQGRAMSPRAPYDVQTVTAACNDYANWSVVQSQANANLACNFSGPRWSADFQFHYEWCLQRGNFSLTSDELRLRLDNLSQCRIDKCTAYGQLAVSQNAKLSSWGFIASGPVWDSDFGHHFNWCMQQGSAAALDEQTNARATVIDASVSNWCDLYAQNSVDDFQENLAWECGVAKPTYSDGHWVWSPNYDDHYNWCIAEPNPTKPAMTEANNYSALASCNTAKCDEYATTAVAQNAQNIADNCGFVGAAWSSLHSYHYSWCRKQSGVSISKSQTQARQAKLDSQCVPPPPTPDQDTITMFKPGGFAPGNYAQNNLPGKAGDCPPLIPTVAGSVVKIENTSGVDLSISRADLGIGQGWNVSSGDTLTLSVSYSSDSVLCRWIATAPNAPNPPNSVSIEIWYMKN